MTAHNVIKYPTSPVPSITYQEAVDDPILRRELSLVPHSEAGILDMVLDIAWKTNITDDEIINKKHEEIVGRVIGKFLKQLHEVIEPAMYAHLLERRRQRGEQSQEKRDMKALGDGS